MSFPYVLDLAYGSEKTAVDNFGRISFSKQGDNGNGDDDDKPKNVYYKSPNFTLNDGQEVYYVFLPSSQDSDFLEVLDSSIFCIYSGKNMYIEVANQARDYVAATFPDDTSRIPVSISDFLMQHMVSGDTIGSMTVVLMLASNDTPVSPDPTYGDVVGPLEGVEQSPLIRVEVNA